MAVNKKWFQQRFAERGFSQNEVARRIGISSSAFSRTLDDERKLKNTEAVALASLFGVEVEDVLRAIGVMPSTPPKRLPAAPTAPKGRILESEGVEVRAIASREARNGPQEAFGAEVVGWIDGEGLVHQEGLLGPAMVSRPSDVAQGCVALRFQSGPLDGWLAYFDPSGSEPGEGVGLLCVARLATGETKLRSVKRGYGAKEFFLVGMDGVTTESAEIVEVHPVLWMKQRG